MQSERGVSVYTVAGHEFRSVCVVVLIDPVSVHTASRAESVSVYPMGRAELVSVYTVSRVESVSVCSVHRAESVSLDAVSCTQSVLGVSVDALSGAEADLWPGAASSPQ